MRNERSLRIAWRFFRRQVFRYQARFVFVGGDWLLVGSKR
jgi:hypothetical protein